MGTIIFDSTNLFQNYGVIVGGGSSFGAAERDVDVEEIPGRSGDLIIDNGRYKNRRATYNAFIYRNASSNVASLRSFLASHGAGYYKLTDSYDTNHFVMARYSGPVDVSMRNLNRVAELNIAFDCKPQRFLTSGDTETRVYSGNTITNPTMFESKPLIRCITVSAGTVLTVNGKKIKFLSGGSFNIDCETQRVYYGFDDDNDLVECAEFPTLSSGSNTISWTGSISALYVRPRWWEL